MLTWCYRRDSPPTELILFRDSVEQLHWQGVKREHTRSCQANHNPNKDHKLSSMVAAQRRNRILGHKARHLAKQVC